MVESPREVRYLPATELLGHTAPLAWRAAVPFMGVPVEFQSNSPTVMEIVEATLGHWRALEPELVLAVPLGRVRLVVHAPDHASGGDADEAADLQPFTYRLHSNLFMAASGDNLLTAHYAHGEALAMVTPALVARDQHFRTNVVESLAMAMTMTHDRVAIHAAGVVRNGRTVLLLGQSQSGKSTLAYACLRAGFQLLAEDVIYVSRHPTLRLWGAAGRLHLLPDAPRFFPELADVRPQIQANGKLKLGVQLARDQIRLHATEAAICVLERGEGTASRLEPLDPACVVEWLAGTTESGFNLFPEIRQVAEVLTRAPTFRLHVGSDLQATVACLEALTTADDRGGAGRASTSDRAKPDVFV